MFTKTGLRPRETHRKGNSNRSSNKKYTSSFSNPPTPRRLETTGGEKLNTTLTVASPFHGVMERTTGDNYEGGSSGAAAATASFLRDQREETKKALPLRAASADRSNKAMVTPSPRSRGAGRVLVMTANRMVMPKGRKKGGRERDARSSSRRKRTDRGSGGRSRSMGRAEDAAERRAARLIRKRPEWDDSLTDASKYRLSPEEAMKRKMSLVSKHNTLVFGLGRSGTGSGNPPSATAMPTTIKLSEEVTTSVAVLSTTPARSSKQIQSNVNKVAGDQHDHHGHRKSRSTGGTSLCGREKAVRPATPAVGDLTASGSNEKNTEIGEKICRHDAQAAAATKRGGESLATVRVDDALGLAGIEAGIKTFSDRVWHLESYKKAGLVAAEEFDDGDHNDDGIEGSRERVLLRSPNIETGDERANGDRTSGEGRSSEGDVGVNYDRTFLSDMTFYSNGAATEYPSEDLVAVGKGVSCREGGDSASCKGGDGDVGHFAESRQHDIHRYANPWNYSDEPENSLLQRKKVGRSDVGRSSARDRREDVDFSERIQLLEAQVRRMDYGQPFKIPVVANDITGNNNKNSENVIATTARKDGVSGNTGKKVAVPSPPPGPGPGLEPTAAASMEDMRVVMADLLSLTALLLKRATVAERRLQDFTGVNGFGGGVLEDCDGGDNGGDDERVRVLRARAKSIIMDDRGKRVSSSPVGEERAPAPTSCSAYTTSDGVKADDGAKKGSGGSSRSNSNRVTSQSPSEDNSQRLSSSPSLLEVAPQSQRRINPLQLRRMTLAASPAATEPKDCWRKALDEVDNLMNGDLSMSMKTSPPSSRRTQPSSSSPSLVAAESLPPPTSSYSTTELSWLPAPVTAQAVDAAAATAVVTPPPSNARVSRELFGSLVTKQASPSSFSASRYEVVDTDILATPTRVWGVRDTLDPLEKDVSRIGDTATVATITNDNWNNATISHRNGNFLRSTRDEKNGEEEGPMSAPVFWTPTPAEKPQHPFERKPPSTRSPLWRQKCAEKEDWGGNGSCHAVGPVFTVEDSNDGLARRQGGGESNGVGGFGGVGGGHTKPPPPAIGQWYTPSRSRIAKG